MKTDTPKSIQRRDYSPPDYRIETVHLDVVLGEETTRVKSKLALEATAKDPGPLVLDGEGMALVSIRVDGKPLDPSAYTVTEKSLTVHAASRWRPKPTSAHRTTPRWRGCINRAAISAPSARRRVSAGSPGISTARM